MNLEYQQSMANFSKWLKEQNGVSEQMKKDSELLITGLPVPQWFADKFKLYLNKYNAILKG
jgi:uncharacterized NAD(P)/FAD-binding protein YdhS